MTNEAAEWLFFMSGLLLLIAIVFLGHRADVTRGSLESKRKKELLDIWRKIK